VIPGRVAAIDIGTNTVRLLVAESRRPGLPGHESLVDLDRRVDVVRLGQGVDATGRLADDAIERTLRVLTTYGEALRSWRPEKVRVVATSATRDAANREEFLDAVALAVGSKPEMISGSREADLAFAGVLSAYSADVSTVVVDLGGGSTEFVYGRERVEYSISVDVGSVRLTERVLGEGPSDAAAVSAARRHADELLAAVDLPGRPDRVVGVAGTFTSLAAINLGLAVYDSNRVDGSALTTADLAGLVEELAGKTTDEIAALGPIDGRRAGVLTAGAIVAERALLATGSDELIVSEADLLDGVALWAAGLVA
jgi:exopolyphosphatase/guanosine-5'-triphosphate,3'-diphosphate pyrophosphatase